MIPLCLMWCIWRKHNSRKNEDSDQTVTELKAAMHKSLYVWMAAYSYCFFNFLCVLFFSIRCFSYMFPCYMNCALSSFFEKLNYLLKKKKKGFVDLELVWDYIKELKKCF
jgi:hypothetical protein